MRRTCAVLLCVCISVASAVTAQDKPPKRPKLGNAADTNDARAYYNHGLEIIDRYPGEAADAFYWATRLDPNWPEALYARRIAGLMANDGLLVRYTEGVPGAVKSRDAQRLDSLEYRALLINPFFPRDLERSYIVRYIVASVNQEMIRRGGHPIDASQQTELDFVIAGYLQTGTSFTARATLAASSRQFGEALGLYARALAGSRFKAGIRVARARIFYLVGAADSALSELQAAMSELRDRESEQLRRVYDSKELYEHAVGLIHEQRGDYAAARDAYGRALQEHLGFYPAHLRLGTLAIAAGDTATAVAELDLAVQVAPNEAMVRMTYGALLAQTGKPDEAEVHLRRAAELEPYFALPQYLLGRLGEQRRNREAAVNAYQAFLARASQRHARRPEVTQRLADLGP